MKEAIKYLKEDLKEYKESFKEAKKYEDWPDVARLSAIIDYLEDLIYYFKSEV